MQNWYTCVEDTKESRKQLSLVKAEVEELDVLKAQPSLRLRRNE